MPVEPPVISTALPARSGMTRRLTVMGEGLSSWGGAPSFACGGGRVKSALRTERPRQGGNPAGELALARKSWILAAWPLYKRRDRRRVPKMTEARKLAAILVSDIVGFSRLAGADEDRIL